MKAAQAPKPIPGPARILVTQVNPFEDVPGYQLLSLLSGEPDIIVDACDDSPVAVDILAGAGYVTSALAHPYRDPQLFESQIRTILDAEQYHAVFRGSDAHLFAMAEIFARSAEVRAACPTLDWLVAHGLKSKWDLQDWAAAHLPTPRRWLNAEDVPGQLRDARRVVVKGSLKECRLIEEWSEVPTLVRQLSGNPANLGPGGRAYFEERLEGSEFCLLLAKTALSVESVMLRKLAATQSGTTMVGQLLDLQQCPFDIAGLQDGMRPGMVLEIEWMAGPAGPIVFEVNPRFPSWVGALGAYGTALVKQAIGAIRGIPSPSRAPRPASGTKLLRLPHSGALGGAQATARERGLLWDPAGPHRFIVK